MSPTRREIFLAAGAAGAAAAAAGLVGCSDDDQSGSGSTTSTVLGPGELPDPKDAPFDTVVVLMMENRSFDHFLGWMPGTDGKQAGLSYPDQAGTMHDTYPIAPDWQGCDLQDPLHLWQTMATHYNDGACDGWLKTQPEGDQFPISYYTRDDLPILAAMAEGQHLYDHYFSSMLGPTWPNRLYQPGATTDLMPPASTSTGDEPRPVKLDLAIFDRLSDAGLTSAYYTWGEPMTGCSPRSGTYDDITYPYEKFLEDAEKGNLANVVSSSTPTTPHTPSSTAPPTTSTPMAASRWAGRSSSPRCTTQWPTVRRDDSVFIMNFDESRLLRPRATAHRAG